MGATLLNGNVWINQQPVSHTGSQGNEAFSTLDALIRSIMHVGGRWAYQTVAETMVLGEEEQKSLRWDLGLDIKEANSP